MKLTKKTNAALSDHCGALIEILAEENIMLELSDVFENGIPEDSEAHDDPHLSYIVGYIEGAADVMNKKPIDLVSEKAPKPKSAKKNKLPRLTLVN